jgi:hypothetical protein
VSRESPDLAAKNEFPCRLDSSARAFSATTNVGRWQGEGIIDLSQNGPFASKVRSVHFARCHVTGRAFCPVSDSLTTDGFCTIGSASS